MTLDEFTAALGADIVIVGVGEPGAMSLMDTLNVLHWYTHKPAGYDFTMPGFPNEVFTAFRIDLVKKTIDGQSDKGATIWNFGFSRVG